MDRIGRTGSDRLDGRTSGASQADEADPPQSTAPAASTSNNAPSQGDTSGLRPDARAYAVIQASLKDWITREGSAAIEGSQRFLFAIQYDTKCLDLASLGLVGPLPSAVHLSPIEDLDAQDNALTHAHIPDLIGARLRSINLSANAIEEFPMGVLHARELNILELENNAVAHVPPAVAVLPELEFLGVQNNDLEDLPMELFSLPRLSGVDASDNMLGELPFNVGLAPKLELLNLSNNQLRTLPHSIYAKDPNDFDLHVNGNPLHVTTRCEMCEWVPPLRSNLRDGALNALADTLALPEGAEELSGLCSLHEMGLNSMDPHSRSVLESRFGASDPRRGLLSRRLAILSPDAASLRTSAVRAAPAEICILLAVKPDLVHVHPDFQKSALEAFRMKHPEVTDEDLPPVLAPKMIREELRHAKFSPYEMLQGSCRAARRISPDDKAGLVIEKLVLRSLWNLGIERLTTATWRAYFGDGVPDPRVLAGNCATAWLLRQAHIVDQDPDFGARGFLYKSVASRSAFSAQLFELQRVALATWPGAASIPVGTGLPARPDTPPPGDSRSHGGADDRARGLDGGQGTLYAGTSEGPGIQPVPSSAEEAGGRYNRESLVALLDVDEDPEWQRARQLLNDGTSLDRSQEARFQELEERMRNEMVQRGLLRK